MAMTEPMDSNHIWSIAVNHRIEIFVYFSLFIDIHSGYIDDVRNTDNAWVEAEIWNFHYGSSMSFPSIRSDVRINP